MLRYQIRRNSNSLLVIRNEEYFVLVKVITSWEMMYIMNYKNTINPKYFKGNMTQLSTNQMIVKVENIIKTLDFPFWTFKNNWLGTKDSRIKMLR